MKRWQIKSFLQKFLSEFPFGENLNFFLQKHVTGNVDRSERSIKGVIFENARLHLDAVHRHISRPSCECLFYEFGAGWDLAGPIAFWCLGVEHQICVDHVRHVRWNLLNEFIECLHSVNFPGVVRLPERSVNSLEGLVRHYGIEYKAPCDARRTGLPAGSINVVTSTYTLEHIPPNDLLLILHECNRILVNGGVMSNVIDYQDHYSHFDSSITRYNFLRYDARVWRWFNSSLHFQSRLRHKDYLQLLSNTGFNCVRDCPHLSSENLEELRSIPIAEEFRQRYSQEELAVRSGHIVSTCKHAA
jgi:hypothetical protein